jgi:hypothetical protein
VTFGTFGSIVPICGAQRQVLLWLDLDMYRTTWSGDARDRIW